MIGDHRTGTGKWNQQWYGIKRFLITWRARPTRCTSVLLSKYRSYTPCPPCAGARLKTESLLWRALAAREDADAVMDPVGTSGCPAAPEAASLRKPSAGV